ncbi:MAG: putative bifunctional diguanylate cyclase/phosphodiesterase [Anaerolineaceae bacterium]
MKMRKKLQRSIFENIIQTPMQIGRVWQVIFIIVSICAAGLFVYATGGSKYVYSHSMYIPIILAGYFFNVPGGILVGIIAGLVLGPWMPLNVTTGEMQTTVNWVYRMGAFVMVGMIQGSIFSLVKKQVEELQRQALFNRYTGIPNRAHLFIDLDRLKADDTLDSQYGIFVIQVDNHSKITRILQMEEMNSLNMMVSQRLKSILGESAVLYQILPYLLCVVMKINNGEEFYQSIAGSIYNEMQAPFEINHVPVFINISIGIAVDKLQQISPTFFLQKGVVAAQIASEKEMKYWVYKQEEFNNARDSQVLLGDIPRGIERHEFNLHYQPIIKLKDGKINGVEALLRWNHGGLGMIPPMSFLPTLEHTSLAYSIHDWEMHEAIEQLTKWDGYKGFLAINLSTRLLLDHNWIQEFENLLETYKVKAGRIVFEITETAIMTNVEKSREALLRLKKIGSMIALDDFGTGYSSLEYIQILPIDQMKIDQRFIKHVHNQLKNQKIVGTAISLAKSIEVETIAEGIESQADYDWLLQAGCKYGQGYLMGKPMPGNALEKWISRREKKLDPKRNS